MQTVAWSYCSLEPASALGGRQREVLLEPWIWSGSLDMGRESKERRKMERKEKLKSKENIKGPTMWGWDYAGWDRWSGSMRNGPWVLNPPDGGKNRIGSEKWPYTYTDLKKKTFNIYQLSPPPSRGGGSFFMPMRQQKPRERHTNFDWHSLFLVRFHVHVTPCFSYINFNVLLIFARIVANLHLQRNLKYARDAHKEKMAGR